MSEDSKCKRCGTPLPPDSPEGLCPRCLMAVNLSPPTEVAGEAGPNGTQVIRPPLPVEEVAKLFPQLEILECLGRGGMGAVYKARQPRLDRLVALKIISPEKQGEPQFAERFEREARALARLHHPNIVTVYDFGEVQGNFYLLMEFVDGLTLRQLMQTRKLSPVEALGIVPKICEALQYAHGQGIVHRDIKPENILLDKAGCVKIADFGIAKILGDGGRTNLTAEQVVGTPHYMAPEQVEHPQAVDHRADIYSLGVVFYEMLTGELPLGKFAPPSRKVQVDVRLDEVVLHALEKEPSRRYQQASQVKTDVETIAGTPTPGQAAGAPLFSSAANQTASDKALLPAFLLSFPFGLFGAHRFYVGKIGSGLTQLGAFGAIILMIIACATTGATFQPTLGILLGFSVIGCGIWAMIDCILIVCKAFTDGKGRRMTNWLHPPTGDLKRNEQRINNPPPPPPSGAVPAAGASPQPAPPAAEKAPATHTGMIIAPAVGLMVAGGWKLFSALTALLFFAGLTNQWLPTGLPEMLGIGSISTLASASLVFFKVIPALLILFGAYQMLRLRSYAWAIAAGIVAIVSCSLIGLPMGIWALIVLAREDVKGDFGKNQPAPQPRPNQAGGSGGVVKIVAGIAVLFLVLALLAGGVLLAYGVAANFVRTADSQTNEISREVNLNFPLAADGRFSIDNVTGRIEISGWDRNEVAVKGNIHGHTQEGVDAVKTDVESDTNRVAIHTRQPSNLTGFPFSWPFFKNIYDERVDYTVQVPRGARLAGITSVNGQITVDGVSGNIESSTVNGKTQIKGAAGDLKLSTVNGQIDAELAALAQGQTVSLNGVNGQIEATLPADADAEVSASTVNGHISSEFPSLVVKKESPASHKLKGTLGRGGAKVSVGTVNSSIRFRRGAETGKADASPAD